MNSNEKFSLKWNKFKDNLGSAFESLREDSDFSDVTLASEDGLFVEAHKVILTVSSPFFKRLLQRSKDSHPIIYMRGIKSDDLKSIMDFLYKGEANIYQDDLECFLKLAEDLQLRGLTAGANHDGYPKGPFSPSNAIHEKFESPKMHKITPFESMKMEAQNKPCTDESSEGIVAIPNEQLQGGLNGLDEQVKSLMVFGPNKLHGRSTRICTVCQKESSQRVIIDHIEANHISGISLQCNMCQKTSRSRASLKMHKFNQHK